MIDAVVSAAQRAYQVTKEQILTGRLPGGTLLSEVEMAQQLRISRTPVHEAFLRLDAEDLIRLQSRRGAVVVSVPAGEAADILDVRVALETCAVDRLCAESFDGAALRELDERLRAEMRLQQEHGARGDLAAFALSDAAFHQAIVAASGNALARRFYSTLSERQQRMTVDAISSRPQRINRLVREHRSLAARIAARDAAGFTASLRAHFDDTHNLLLGR